MICESNTHVVEAKDLSPIQNLDADTAQWLEELAKSTDTAQLALRLSQKHQDADALVVEFDSRTGQWWTGRFVGEIHFNGRTLRILPRFGMPQLQRWLSRIWNIRLTTTKGDYATSRTWLWELLAALWNARLVAAAKHGLPTKRIQEAHKGAALRGRLSVRATAREFTAGRRILVSHTRNRLVDDVIGGTILCAFRHLRRELRHLGDERSWLSPRALDIVTALQARVDAKSIGTASRNRKPIRYTPITQSYRSVVELSAAIAAQQPFAPVGKGQKEVFGVLIDMAEVWELYVFHLLRSVLPHVDVIHTGRSLAPENHLLMSSVTGERLGGLMPDIELRALGGSACLALIDAKYKATTPTPDRPYGVVREDLYQLAAYLAAYGTLDRNLPAALVYPVGADSQRLDALQTASPWRLCASDRTLSFMGLRCDPVGPAAATVTASEEDLGLSVNSMLVNSQSRRAGAMRAKQPTANTNEALTV